MLLMAHFRPIGKISFITLTDKSLGAEVALRFIIIVHINLKEAHIRAGAFIYKGTYLSGCHSRTEI